MLGAQGFHRVLGIQEFGLQVGSRLTKNGTAGITEAPLQSRRPT